MTVYALLWNYLRCSVMVVVFVAVVLTAENHAISDEMRKYDVSRTWFTPSLAVNNDPQIGVPLLKGYMNFFHGMETINPLEADFNGERERTDSIALILEDLQEVEWKETDIDGDQLRIAEINLDDKYYAIVRRYYSIGWREGFLRGHTFII